MVLQLSGALSGESFDVVRRKKMDAVTRQEQRDLVTLLQGGGGDQAAQGCLGRVVRSRVNVNEKTCH